MKRTAATRPEGRREMLAAGGMAALAATLPMPAIGQAKPVRIGLLTVKTGPLAQGGIQMEQGAELFLGTGTISLPDGPPS